MEILGEKIKLRPLEERDLNDRAEWISDPEIARLIGLRATPGNPRTPEQWRDVVDRWFQSRSSIPGVHLFAILNLSDALIGDIDLQVVSGSGGMAWMSIEIGDREYWGHGYGTDAINALLRYAFRQLRIRQVRLNVKKFNERAIRCYEKCGFVKESEQRDEYLMVAMAESCEL